MKHPESIRHLLATVLTVSLTVSGHAAAPRAGVFMPEASDAERSLAGELAGDVMAAGYEVIRLDPLTLAREEVLRTNRLDLVVVGNARTLPAPAVPGFEAHLRRGGDVLALGVPAWSEARHEIAGRWMCQADYERAVAAQRPQALIEDFEQVDLKAWSRQTNDRATATRHELANGEGSRALHVVIDNLTGWDTFASPALRRPFPGDHTLTCFRARGGPRTRQLALEWTERDGSRWMAVVDLASEWRSYVLPPEAFKAWQPPLGRGGPGDRLQVANAVRLVVGLAHSHTGASGGRHEYWLDEVGTAPPPFDGASPPEPARIPRLETLAPSYLFYPVNGPVRIGTPEAGASGETFPWDPAGEHLRALHPRPRGVGFDQDRPWRWEPLLVAHAADGDHRGAVATLMVHRTGVHRGGVWAAFTPAAPEFYGKPGVRRQVREVLGRMRRGVFLLEGGSDFFTVFEGQTVRLGARVAHFGTESLVRAQVRVRVTAGADGTVVHTGEWPVALSPGTERTVESNWSPGAWPAGGLVVTIELVEDGRVLDRLSHELHVWRPPARPRQVEARDGGFWLEGRPWKAQGVNYMPSSGLGLADQRNFEHWIGRGPYDPEVIGRDLARIRALGLNAVSVFVYHESRRGHLLDFLRRCEALGLRVNLSLRPGTPMDFRWNEMRELIEGFRLAQHDSVFAYDLAWEPSHYDHDYQQKHYARPWREWVVRRHGSVAAAEAAWGVPAAAPAEIPVPAGGLSVPSMAQLTRDGPWRKRAADYRAFLDERVGERYAEARRLVKSIDPHHPVSFRMQFAGDPTHLASGLLPYDFHGLTGAVDIWEPEAYGRVGDWEKVKPGHFTAAYARLCDPAKPVLWAEMGYSVWDMRTMAPHPEKLRFAARYYADFYRMLRESGADGVFFWWYAGGFRLNENSDYGILEPDGTDRELTRVIREEGARFLAAPKPAAGDHVITVDRDRDARGLPGIYEAVREDYWRAVNDGHRPVLRWLLKPGTTGPATAP